MGTRPATRRPLLRVEPDGRVIAAVDIDLETFESSLPVQKVVVEVNLHTSNGSCSQLFPTKVNAEIEFYGTLN